PLIAELIIKRLPNPLRRQRVRSDQQRPESLDNRRVEPRRSEALAPAYRAILANDLDDATGACVSAIERPGKRRVDFCFEDMGSHFGDLHWQLLAQSPPSRTRHVPW